MHPFGGGVQQEPSMERRIFVAMIAGGLLAAPLAAEAQTGKMPREYHYRVLANPSTNADSTHSGKDYGKVMFLSSTVCKLSSFIGDCPKRKGKVAP
jgi:hypothetical protein